MLIIGMGALTRADGEAILAMAKQVSDAHEIVTDDWNGFNVLHTAAARVGGLDIEFVPANGGSDIDEIQTKAQSGEIGLVYLLGADEVNMDGFGDAFIVYQGHHGDAGAHRADVVLPGAAYTEKPATYVNTEGRVQMAARATFPPGEARDDWAVIRALSGVLNHPLPFDTLDKLRENLRNSYPSMLALNSLTASKWDGFEPNEGKVDPAPLTNIVSNFYMTNSITRASETMAQCTEELGVNALKASGTNG